LGRTFFHQFEPTRDSPVQGTTVDLEVQEVENAGIKEVLQTPGAGLGTWSLFDRLLAPTGEDSPFIFREPLGQAREVKVALSGLFGRFIARAYLERYMGASIFSHLGQSPLILDGRYRIEVVRRESGDLPDWIACPASFSQVIVAEAKGCHDYAGPGAALGRAWKQVHRVDILVQGRKATVKRIAVATRWGSSNGGSSDAFLSVRDPVDEGEPMTPDQSDSMYLGLLRTHVANLIAPLGHEVLASNLRALREAPSLLSRDAARTQALHDLDATAARDVVSPHGAVSIDALVGGVVTRAGPVSTTDLSTEDQLTLSRLDLRPVFVGVERNIVRAAISDDASEARRLTMGTTRKDDVARADAAGDWIVPLGDERRLG
jgi:hypothetical protein